MANAEAGSGDLASVVNTGSVTDTADAGGLIGKSLGNFDIASVLGTESTATAGSDLIGPGSFDLAAVVDEAAVNATATGGNFLVDILPSL
jgi:hypothetical protein